MKTDLPQFNDQLNIVDFLISLLWLRDTLIKQISKVKQVKFVAHKLQGSDGI